eukprot:7988907-Ditylum_brightwellii.AAC.1
MSRGMRGVPPKKKLLRLGNGSFCTGFAIVDIAMNVVPQEEDNERIDCCLKIAPQLHLEGENNKSMVKLVALLQAMEGGYTWNGYNWIMPSA